MLPASEKPDDMFSMLKARFPHLDLTVIDTHRTFSENLQDIVAQLGMPPPPDTRHEISSMKDAVDKQQLKIQTSLVNEEDVLGNITNRATHRSRQHKEELRPIQQEDSHVWQEHSHVGGSDIMSDIWEWGSHHQHHHFKDWFHH